MTLMIFWKIIMKKVFNRKHCYSQPVFIYTFEDQNNYPFFFNFHVTYGYFGCSISQDVIESGASIPIGILLKYTLGN